MSQPDPRPFADAVSYERELTGMDSSAAELLERYRSLTSGILELTIIIYNS